MYQELIEKNRVSIAEKKSFRSFGGELKILLWELNEKKIVTISGLRHTGRTSLVSEAIKKSNSLDRTFYFNAELDALWVIRNKDDFIILFDMYVRIYWVPKIIVLQNMNNITGIKSLIWQFISTKKYKIILVGNNIKVEWVRDLEVFPLAIWENSENNIYWWIPEVRILPDNSYKDFVLWALKNDIIMVDIIESYGIKNITLFYKVIWYLAQCEDHLSVREIHRNLTDHHIGISHLTLIDYINAAVTTRLLSKCYQHDLKTWKDISSKIRYYFGDSWIRKSFHNSASLLCKNSLYLDFLQKWYTVKWWINGRFYFDFIAEKWSKVFHICFSASQDKSEIRKTARKLAKIWTVSKKYLIIENKNTLGMRKFIEDDVQIIEFSELIWKIN